MVDCSPSNARDFCPTADELAPQYLALLPRGRAWGEGGPGREPGGILYGWIYALAIVMAAAHATLCTLKLEFFCATATATLDLWQEDYGLPDDCDPYADVCAKVAATGGVTCAYYEEVAASIGWSITCGTSCAIDCGLIEAGMVGGPVAGPGTLMFVVYLAGSSAFSGSTQVMGPVAGFLEAGMAPACGPDITALDCVMQRIAPAHADIVYSLV